MPDHHFLRKTPLPPGVDTVLTSACSTPCGCHVSQSTHQGSWDCAMMLNWQCEQTLQQGHVKNVVARQVKEPGTFVSEKD